MAKSPPAAPPQDAVPGTFPNVVPVDLYPTSDIRFVMVELGKLDSRITHLADTIEKQTAAIEKRFDKIDERISKQSDKIDALDRTVDRTIDRVKTGFFVAVPLITLFFGAFWWAVGDRITSAIRSAYPSSTQAVTVAPLPPSLPVQPQQPPASAPAPK